MRERGTRECEFCKYLAQLSQTTTEISKSACHLFPPLILLYSQNSVKQVIPIILHCIETEHKCAHEWYVLSFILCLIYIQLFQYHVTHYVPLPSDIEEHYLGPFTCQCPHCHALHWLPEKQAKSSKKEPDFAECCCASEVSIDFLDRIPMLLHLLYEGNDHQAVEFHRNICQYNKALAFTSTGGSGHLVGSSYNGCGPPQYKIQGEIHHQIGPILPEDDQPPLYSQMYIYNHNDALQF